MFWQGQKVTNVYALLRLVMFYVLFIMSDNAIKMIDDKASPGNIPHIISTKHIICGEGGTNSEEKILNDEWLKSYFWGMCDSAAYVIY